MKKSPAAISIYFHQKMLIIKKLDSFKDYQVLYLETLNENAYWYQILLLQHLQNLSYLKKQDFYFFTKRTLTPNKIFFSQKLLRVGVSNHQRFLLLYVSVCTVKEKQIKNFWYHFFHFLDVLIWTDSKAIRYTK